ncbi:putative PEP-CTERM system TPR-repeat lipoprotein [Limihaloglobus sulfuriphilus]|uniref:Putative PEP-CTERM system TPR-repeat lipoprotein n=1 Tax=Limihaloglobus sulfuriphilus TaxID=1851148 RepID=A0A1Q2MBS3_9BACT|nr:CDC27 family protein [Limihaloglobus sulfuriphilus]AQQ69727.1 putative PEP-CTERM system TPR-repeat lipoprotein [Limihaloglobus sulfuriphilus]
MDANIRDLILSKNLKLSDCIKLDRPWAKMAFRYKKIRKKAKNENPPGENLFLCGLLQSLVSKDRSYLDNVVKFVRGNIPEDKLLCLAGMALVDIGHYDDGICMLRKSVEIKPSIEHLEALAGSLEKPEDLQEKLELANQILEINPDDVDGLRHKIFVLLKDGSLDEAELLAKQALSIAPNNLLAKDVFCEVLFRKGNYAKALELYKNTYNYFNRSHFIWQQIAICYNQLGQYKKARKAGNKMAKAARKIGIDYGESELDAFWRRMNDYNNSK